MGLIIFIRVLQLLFGFTGLLGGVGMLAKPIECGWM